MSDTDQGVVWGNVMLAGAQMVEWRIKGADESVEGTTCAASSEPWRSRARGAKPRSGSAFW